MNAYKAIGAEWLFDNHVCEKLDKYIMENTMYTVPGYKYNYRFCSFFDRIEFHRCEMLDRTHVNTDIHFTGNDIWELEVCNADNEDSTAPICLFLGKNGEQIPVRLICPDVLPSIEKGDKLKGQVVAFADEVVKMPDDFNADGKIVNAGNNCVRLNGFVEKTNFHRLEFEGHVSEFWEIRFDSEMGSISLLIAENRIDFVPEVGDKISSYAMISMDVAFENPRSTPGVYPANVYEDVLSDADRNCYRYGFWLGFKRNQKALIKSIKTGDIERFTRCCNDTVQFRRIKDNAPELLIVDKNGIVDELGALLPENVEEVEIKHFISCEDKACIGHDAIVIYSDGIMKLVIWFDICEIGKIDQIQVFNPDECILGVDYELHLQAMFSHSLCDGKWLALQDCLSEECLYRSEYADAAVVGADRIIDRIYQIISNIKKHNNRLYDYTYEFSLSEDELYVKENLPLIYQGNRCTVYYQGDKLAYVLFLIFNDEHKIINILLSCNPDYLKRFKHQKVDGLSSEKADFIKDKLSAVYGNVNTLQSMRENDIPDFDENDVYVWKKADEFAREWLRDNGYNVTESVLADDCLGYACERRGSSYAVFFYAYGTEKTTQLDGNYCSRLRNEKIAVDREIIIIYLHVDKTVNNEDVTEYIVSSFSGSDEKIMPWLLTNVNGTDILRFYPSKEMMDLIPRLISAYNSKNLDALKMLCSSDVYLKHNASKGNYHNDGFYSCLSNIREQYGKMKLAYIRFSDVVFYAVPYIDNYTFINFSVNADNKINSIKTNNLSDDYCEILITDEMFDNIDINNAPLISALEFLKPSVFSRFSVKLTFENGEIRRYDFQGEFDDEIAMYQQKIMTDKIFANGRLVSHLPKPEWLGYKNYSQRGQGIEFISGAAVSTLELYNDSYPVERFSYEGMDDVHLKQLDYDDEGIGVGCISNLDPQNPCYVLDSNTMTATALPDEYQKTPIAMYPFCGGSSEGLIMVSKTGELNLKYHHNRRGCAGIWGWLDRGFNTVIEPKYIYAMNFVEGRAIVCKGIWDIEIDDDGQEIYWCYNEQWGVIDKAEREIVPCRFDELYEIDNTDKLYLVHEGGWENGHYSIFDTGSGNIVLAMDFDFDPGYMFNQCFVTDNGILVLDEHLPGEEKDLIYAYDLANKKYIAYGDPLEGRTFNGETKSVVNKDGIDIIIF